MSERPFAVVPKAALAAAVLCLGAQIAVNAWLPGPRAEAAALPRPPSAAWLKVASLGEPVSLAKWLMLWLQAFDNPPGISIPFARLDYDRVIEWLDAILLLDPDGQYPLLAASRLYGEVPDPAMSRKMFDFVYRKYLEDPNRRWPWLAHAAVAARHRLGDLALARAYAQALREKATGPHVPHWVWQMEALLAADLNELDAARVLLGGLLESGRVTDPHEARFLRGRLEELERRAGF